MTSALDLLDQLLDVNWMTRSTAEAALRHPFFTSANYIAPEQPNVALFDWSFYVKRKSAAEWHGASTWFNSRSTKWSRDIDATVHEVAEFHREAAAPLA